MVRALGLDPAKVAVERNLEIVPRSTLAEVLVSCSRDGLVDAGAAPRQLLLGRALVDVVNPDACANPQAFAALARCVRIRYNRKYPI